VINFPAPLSNAEDHLDFVSGKDLISIADALSFSGNWHFIQTVENIVV
jgi:hypothetical protein